MGPEVRLPSIKSNGCLPFPRLALGALAILTPGVCAFLASKELRWRFISTSSLEKPPEGSVVATLRAFNIRCRHGLYLFFLLAQYLDFCRRFRLDFLRTSDAHFSFLSKPTLLANHDGRRFLRLESQSGSALWTEFHNSTTP